MRIGIHTGPLVAGVVGSNKFAYDVWGDSVNIAARMEESGEVGQVNVSETVYECAKDQFDFEYRGEVKAKNKGMMKMFFLKD
jgi:class 3 adenylate cyclase